MSVHYTAIEYWGEPVFQSLSRIRNTRFKVQGLLTKSVSTTLLFVVKVHQSQRQLFPVVCTYSIHTSAMHTFVITMRVCVCVVILTFTWSYVWVTQGRLAMAKAAISPLFSRILHTLKVWSVTAAADLSECTDPSSETGMPNLCWKECLLHLFLDGIHFSSFFFKEKNLNAFRC